MVLGEESVLIRVLTSGMEKHIHTALGDEESVLFREEVSLIQELKIHKHGSWGGRKRPV